MTATKHPNSHVVYEVVDRDGTVIYVGATKNIHLRFLGHKSRSTWWGDMAHFRVTPCRNRIVALEMEAALLALHQPTHNIYGTDALPRERGSVSTEILHLLYQNSAMTAGEIRVALGKYNNTSVYLGRLRRDGSITLVDRLARTYVLTERRELRSAA